MFNPLTFTGFHTWLSIIALAAGLVVIAAWLRGEGARTWAGVFLVTAILTSVTGFLFPFTGFLPSHGVGLVSLVVLAAAGAGWWRSGGAPGALTRIGFVAATYLLAFVAVAQTFMKVAALGGPGTGFAVTQLVVLALFVGLGWSVWSRSRRVLSGA